MKARVTLAVVAAILVSTGEKLFAQPALLRLSMGRAVALALAADGNPRIGIADEAIRQAEQNAVEARSALLPSFDIALGERRQSLNLATFGLSPATVPGAGFPRGVGPFNVFDARISATQTIFDLRAVRQAQAAAIGIDTARGEGAAIQEQVAAQVATTYLTALRAQATVEARQANVVLAETVLKQADAATRAGTGTGIDTTRAAVQLASERHRLLSADIDRRRSLLALRRAIGVSLETPIELVDRLEYVAQDRPVLDGLLAKARSTRADVAAQQTRELDAGFAARAARAERMPTVSAYADYGSIGADVNSSFTTRTFGVAVRIPLVDGGRRGARQAAAASRLRAERLRTRDLGQQVELELRIVIEQLDVAEQQVQVTRDAAVLANEEVAQAQRRHEAGVAGGLEIVEAQTRLARAKDDEIAALFTYNEAALALRQATGTVRELVP
jgi:outer membrane protein TolC